MSIIRILVAIALCVTSLGARAAVASASPSQPVNSAERPLAILELGKSSQVRAETGFNHDLVVTLSAKEQPPDAARYVLFLNGREIEGLESARLDPGNSSAIIFHLQRNATNEATFRTLLGSPSRLTRSLNVALGIKSADQAFPTIIGASNASSRVNFKIASMAQLLFAIVAILLVLGFVWGSAHSTAIIKDNLIPQIDPKRQTYSLGRWQMAVWFSLIFASYVFLWILLDDPNTLSSQALMLMGISGATALGAVAVDAMKDTPEDSLNQGLRLLGINSYDDVVRIRAELADKLAQLNSPASAAARAQLQTDIANRQAILRTYEDRIRPFVSQGWFKDIVTDVNGTALHRVQVVCWTLLLGVIFVIGVWRDLAMPQFDGTLLALMAISNAGYIGFKYPETQS